MVFQNLNLILRANKIRMKRLIFILSLVLFIISLYSVKAQDKDLTKKLKETKTDIPDSSIKTWRAGGFGSLLFNQTSLSNWAAGGENSVAITTIANAWLKYFHKKLKWETDLNFTYGIQRIGKGDFQKNNDQINLISRFGVKARKNLYYLALLNLLTQATPTFKDSVLASHFFAPAWVLAGVGLEYTKDAKDFSLFFAPALGKFTIVNNVQLADAGAYGVTPAEYDTAGNLIAHGKKLRKEFGAMLMANYSKKIKDYMEIKSFLQLFNNYTDPNKPNRKNIDVNFQTLLNFKISEYITTSLNVQIIYDNDIDIPVDDNGDGTPDRTAPRTQIMEVFGLGVTYKFK